MWYYSQNGQQVGPVSQEELQVFLRARSLPLDSNVWRDGMAGWMSANQVPELMAGVSGGYLPQTTRYLPMGGPPASNSMALTSMILGILGIFVAFIFTAVPAIICGHIARKQIRESGGAQSGDGMALTGLITGYLVTLLTLLFIVGAIIFLFYVSNETSSSGVPGGGSSPLVPPSPSTPVPVPAPVPTP